ncbi:MAG: glycosyltransferase [Syntrophobacteraceae bacterium]
MPQSAGLSVCMIVKNESANLDDALASFVPFADEIVVVDTGSSDNTKEIASRFTPNVFDFEWIDDFAAARNFAISKATGSYQLWLDADDRISPENGKHINSLKQLFNGKKGFYFVLENHQADAPSSFCQQLRCIPLTPEVRFEGRIHEQIFPSAVRSGLELVTTDIVIRHVGYMTEEMRFAKAKRNLEILERERAAGTDHGGLYFFLALTHAPMGNKDEAVRYMEAALERFEKEYYNHHLIPEGYLFLAKVSLEQEDKDKCVRYLAKAASVVTGSPLHNFQIGIMYQRLGKHFQAIRSFQEVSGKDYVPNLFPTQPLPSPSEILLHMAYSCYCMNDRPGALKLINAAAGEGNDAARSWEWMGTKAFAFQNMGLAQLAFETALRFGDLEPRSWGHLASLYELHGFSDKSEECLLKASVGAKPSGPNLPANPASFSAGGASSGSR